MKAILKTQSGTKKGEINLPSQFNEEIRPDLIKRAVLAIKSHKRQPYGADPDAGHKYSSKLSRRRRDYRGAYGHGISRVPRKIMSHRGSRFNWEGASAPNTRGGMQAHPPKAEKIFTLKINKKERRKAIRSALSAVVLKNIVLERGHIVEDYPIVLEDSIQDLNKTKDVLVLLNKLGFEKELVRSQRKSEKSGRARRRGRHYKKAVGPLLVVSEKCNLLNSAVNIPGIDVVEVQNLNAELLAPGTDIGRLTLFTKSSIEKIENLKLFTDNPIFEKQVKVKKLKQKTEKKSKLKSKKVVKKLKIEKKSEKTTTKPVSKKEEKETRVIEKKTATKISKPKAAKKKVAKK